MNFKIIFTFLYLCVWAGTLKADVDANEEEICVVDSGPISVNTRIYSELNEISSENRNYKNECFEGNQQLKKLTRSILDSQEKLTLEFKNLNKTIAKKQFDIEEAQLWSGNFWTVIQRRSSGQESFDRNWHDYKYGFGNHISDFWLGLETIYRLTNAGRRYELLIIVEDINHERRYAIYDDFQIASESEKYKLKKLGNYKGTAAESLFHHLGHKFTTKDQNNDVGNTKNCALLYPGGWWFIDCFHSHLNGVYRQKPDVSHNPASGIHWLNYSGHHRSLKFAQMMIRMV